MGRDVPAPRTARDTGDRAERGGGVELWEEMSAHRAGSSVREPWLEKDEFALFAEEKVCWHYIASEGTVSANKADAFLSVIFCRTAKRWLILATSCLWVNGNDEYLSSQSSSVRQADLHFGVIFAFFFISIPAAGAFFVKAHSRTFSGKI